MKKIKLVLFVAVLCLGFPLFSEEARPIWRVIYNSGGWIPPGASRAELEWLYGGNVKIIPSSGNPMPKKPMLVPGPVFSKYPGGSEGDDKWILSETGENPARDWVRKVEKWRKDGAPVLGKFDIYDKRGEAKFLEYVTPEMAPTPTLSFAEYNAKPHPELSDTEKEEVERRVSEAMDKANRRSPKIKADLIQIETLRRSIHKEIGKSIIKSCLGCGSEGILPMTHKDQWVEQYLDYLKSPANHKGYGEVLKDIVAHPDGVLLQKMVDIKREVRFHIFNGKILEDAMFPRYYPGVAEYLADEDKATIKKALEEKFLAQLPKKLGPEFENFMATGDAALTKEGRVVLIDLNAGVDSGFYNPWEDIIVINRLSEALAGAPTPLLKDWQAIFDLPIGSPEKVEKTKAFLERLSYFIDDHNQDQYWGRLGTNYRKLLEKTPTARQFGQALKDLQAAGLKDGKLFLQFINHVQDTISDSTGAPLRLSEANQKYWKAEIERLSPEIEVSVKDKALSGDRRVPDAAPTSKVCAVLKKI
jgi:hypothetical protein